MSAPSSSSLRSGNPVADERRPTPVHPALLLAGMFVVALNMRTVMASLPPLLTQIETEVGLDGTGAGLLTALPVLCMGVFAPGAQRLAHRIGREAAVAVALTVVTVGLGLRLAGDEIVPLFAGTLLGGIGIAVLAVGLPGIVREFFADRAGTATGIYMTGLSLGASISAGLAVPMESWLGSWEASLASWSLLGVLALACWLPVVLRANERADTEPSRSGGLPWRSRTGWLVCSYMATQSLLFYCVLAWLAPSYEAGGESPGTAGLLLAVFMGAQLLTSVAIPALADRRSDRRPWFVFVVSCAVLGLMGLWVSPQSLPWAIAAALGIGLGGGFALGLVLLVDHARTASESGRLSAMAFLVCYAVASVGPAVVGTLRDVTGGFDVSWALLLAVAVLSLALTLAFSPARRTRGL